MTQAEATGALAKRLHGKGWYVQLPWEEVVRLVELVKLGEAALCAAWDTGDFIGGQQVVEQILKFRKEGV